MIKKVEELLINSDLSMNIILDNGFLIRCFNIIDRCVINMVDRDRETADSDIIKFHAEKLKRIGLDPCYRIIHDSDYEKFDLELVRYGFDIVDRGAVMALKIENMERELFAFANFYEQGIIIENDVSEEWIEDYRDLARLSKNYGDTFQTLIQSTLDDRMFAVLLQDSRLIGMGYMTFYDQYMIINSIYVDERFGKLGYGSRLLKAMLIKGLLRGCKYAIADVREEQEFAIKMLLKQGFEVAYNYQLRGKQLV